MMASAANCAGTKMIEVFAFVSATASATVLNTGTFRGNTSLSFPPYAVPPLPGVTPATTFVPYSSICLVWNVPSPPVMP